MLMKMSMTAIAAVITSTSKDKDKNYRYKRGRAEKLTSKQIKRAAASQLRQNFEGISMAVLNQFALITFMLLIEALIYITSELSDIDYRPLQLSYYRESRVRIFTMCGRMLGYLFLNSVLVYIQRRRFINTGEDGGVVERYIAMHPKRIMLPGVKLSIQLFFYKILVLSPISVGIYGVLHFSSKEVVSSISLFGMVCFMLSIGFSIVWLGVCIHYFMSLSLVPFISQLNPRANFFRRVRPFGKADGVEAHEARLFLHIMAAVAAAGGADISFDIHLPVLLSGARYTCAGDHGRLLAGQAACYGSAVAEKSLLNFMLFYGRMAICSVAMRFLFGDIDCWGYYFCSFKGVRP